MTLCADFTQFLLNFLLINENNNLLKTLHDKNNYLKSSEFEKHFENCYLWKKLLHKQNFFQFSFYRKYNK